MKEKTQEPGRRSEVDVGPIFNQKAYKEEDLVILTSYYIVHQHPHLYTRLLSTNQLNYRHHITPTLRTITNNTI